MKWLRRLWCRIVGHRLDHYSLYFDAIVEADKDDLIALTEDGVPYSRQCLRCGKMILQPGWVQILAGSLMERAEMIEAAGEAQMSLRKES